MQSLFVTHVSTFNNMYLRVYGQMDPTSIKVIKNNIESLYNSPTIKNSIPRLDQLVVGNFCIARNEQYYLRARIIGILPKLNQLIVHFMDYGFDRKIDISDIRIGNFPKELEYLPVQATPFIVCGIVNDWQPYQIEEITNELLWRDIDICFQMNFAGQFFADLIWKNKNLADYIMEIRGYGKPIKFDQLRADIFKLSKQKHSIFKPIGSNSNIGRGIGKSVMPVRQLYANSNTSSTAQLSSGNKPVIGCLTSFRTMVEGIQNENFRLPYTGNPLYGTPRLTIDNMSPPRNAVATFKSTTLMVGNTYDVECSFVDNGPCSFSVHLKSSINDLSKMMNELELIELKNIYEKPTLGMACIARFPVDRLCYRAIIMNIKLTGCQVSYIDYGNHEYVQYHDIFEIPQNFLEKKSFSVRFALSGYKDLEPINDNLKNMFKELVLYKTFKLKVTPLEGPPLVQYCELYDENNQNIFELLKQYKNRKLTYKTNETLDKTDIIIVCYIESPKKFFVQKLKNQNIFESMMDELFLYCNKNKSPLINFTIGTPCAVKFENAWYRAEVIEEIDNNKRITIRHIDFGNERKCDPNCLSEIAEKFTLYPPQAIQCCLKGFENSDLLTAETTITQFEMLAETSDGERRQFKTNIFKMHTSNCYLLNLIDDTLQPELNLMKRLFKLNMPFNKYIGMEKENFNNVNNINKSTNNTSIENIQNLKRPVIVRETSSQQTNVNNDRMSTGSSENNSINNDYRSGGGGGGDSPQRKSSPQQNGNKYQQKREQNSAGRFEKGIRNNLPPRFQNQKQQQEQRDNNRRPNSQNNSYEKQHNNSSETSGIFSQTAKSNSKNYESNWSNTSDNNEEYIPIEQDLQKMNLNIPTRDEVLICWWISPHQFYTHHINRTSQFEQMMKDIQIFYKNKETTKLPINVGASVIARYCADNTLYRAKILACNKSLRKYKVEFIDFGNQSTVTDNDIWLIEKRFANEPIMAKLCGFENIISQFEHSYITNELEKYLKPGATVYCNYLREENDLYFVDIELNNNSSLKELLIEKGLIAELKPGTMLEILVGQQIKGKIISIKDLLNFQILIEGCDIKLLCSYSDIKFVKANLHLSSEFKRCYEGKSCSFDVIELTGEKILMVQPIIPLFTKNIEPVICNYPLISDTMNIKISYVSNVNKLYAHLISIEDELNKLLDDMFNYYNEKGNIINEIELGLICAANSIDGNWYRAQIISNSLKTPPPNNTGTITKNDSIEVYYIDYGNTEIIDNINKLKRLDDSFLTISALAIELYLPIKSIINKTTGTKIISYDNNNDDDINVINRITALTENYELQLKLLDQYEKSWIVDIQSDCNSLKDILRNEGLIESNDDFEYIKNLILLDNETKRNINSAVTKNVLKNDQNNKIETISITTTIDNNNKEEIVTSNLTNIPDTIVQPLPVFPQIKLQKAYISHCDNPGRFFLQLASDIDELEKMQDNIQIVASSLPPLMTTVPGASCIALYAVDNIWYRAKIKDNEIMAVQFTDYGNTDVDIDPENIREMNEAFAKIKSFAIPCSLAVAPKNTTDWVDDANKIFLKSLENIVDFEFISMGNGETSKDEINYINLYIDNKNVADYLCDENLAKKLECIESGSQCFVSHLNNLSDFYLELEHDAQGLELIAEYLADYEKFPIIEKSTNNENVNKICAAIFPDDGEWYRAKILSESSNGFEVLFIDFGNTTITYETRQMSDEISNVPFLSKKCSLRMPDYILGWSDEAEKKFIEISALGQQIFKVILKEPSSECAIVDLLIDGKNLLEILEPICDRKPENLLNISTSTEISDINNFISNTKSINISHINSPGDFYIQFNSDSIILEKITNNLLNEIEKNDKLENPQVGEICAAIFLDDGALYRAEILSKEMDCFNVLFIDFGNCSISTDLRKLPENLLEIPPLAKNCSLLGSNLNNPAVIEKFNSIINPIINENFDMQIVDDSQNLWIVNLSYLKENISEQIKEFQLSIDGNNSINIQNLQNIIISHVVSITEFYVQFESENEKVELISNMLTNLDKLLPVSIEKVKIGEIYAALFPDDECYYRAKIIEINDNIIQVFFIDFGNSSKTTDLRILPNDLKNLQNLAIKCQLHHNLNKDCSNDIIDKQFIALMDSHFGESLQMNVIEKLKENDNNDYWKVKLFVKNLNIINELEKLIKLNLNENQISPLINNVQKCTISHCNSPNDFYIQLSNDTNQLEDITKKLSQAELNFNEFPILSFDKINLNDLCAAKFPDDGAYYRAKIIKINQNDCNVLYIDFGNIAITNDLRQLPNELKQIQCVAKHCTLIDDNNLTDIDFYSKNTIDCMQQLINSHLNETFQVDILNDTINPWIVKLYYQNKNFIDQLYNTIKDILLRNDDDNIIWNDNNINNSSASSSTLGITNDLINEITNNDQIISHELLGNIVDNFNVDDCNTTQEIAQELYNGYQEILSHPNAVKK